MKKQETGCPPVAAARVGRRRRTYRARLTHCDFFMEKHIGSFVRECLRRYVSAGTRVGDLGCGEQPFREEVEQLGGSYIGIDLTQNRDASVEVLADAGALPFPENHFDVILCTELLEHLADPRRAIAEMARVIRKTGRVILTVPFMYPLHEEPRDYLRLTPHAMQDYARTGGLEVESLRTAGNELEVMATVWANLWCRSSLARRCAVVDRLLLPLFFAPVNGLGGAASLLLHRCLPCKSYLNVLCALVKSGDGQGQSPRAGRPKVPQV
jgi:SAM-dependent methyltransferase